jgi:hypothetical protein
VNLRIDGECHCGKIVYQAEVDPDTLVICHCTDCQILAGSPYRAVIPAPGAAFVMLRGEPKIYLKTTERGTKVAHGFCGDCGTPIYACAPTNPDRYGLRIGAIKQRAELHPVWQIWCRSALPWAMDLSAVKKDDGQMNMLNAVSKFKLPSQES